jgi:drug/metabolite transporter (DMT)-like permease
MLISASMGTVMNLIIKQQSSTTSISVVEAVIVRNFVMAIGAFLHLVKDKANFIDIPQRLWKFIMMRAVFGSFATFSLYIALDYIPLSQAITINYTSPVLISVACFIFLGEKLAKIEVVSVISALFGVVLMT